MAEQIAHLVKMANHIAVNFGEQRDLIDASRRTAEHLEKFWTPRMREQLAHYVRAGGDGISPAVAACFNAGFTRQE